MEGSGIGQFIPLILIFVIFYFFLIRPQQKKVKEHKAMVESLKRGDKVVTSGGITGTVERLIDNDKVEVEIAENVKVEIVKSTGIQSGRTRSSPRAWIHFVRLHLPVSCMVLGEITEKRTDQEVV